MFSSISKKAALFITACILLIQSHGCVSLRTDLEGKYIPITPKEKTGKPVNILFHFSHLEQSLGFDVVPKIISPIRGFRDIFQESIKQLQNIKRYHTFTDYSDDVDNLVRRELKDSLKLINDYTIHITIERTHSFRKHFLADLFYGGSLTVIPVIYSWDYVITAEVSSTEKGIIKTLERKSSLTQWSHMLLIFAYPFYPPEVKIEEVYLESLKDIFKEIEADGVLIL